MAQWRAILIITTTDPDATNTDATAYVDDMTRDAGGQYWAVELDELERMDNES